MPISNKNHRGHVARLARFPNDSQLHPEAEGPPGPCSQHRTQHPRNVWEGSQCRCCPFQSDGEACVGRDSPPVSAPPLHVPKGSILWPVPAWLWEVVRFHRDRAWCSWSVTIVSTSFPANTGFGRKGPQVRLSRMEGCWGAQVGHLAHASAEMGFPGVGRLATGLQSLRRQGFRGGPSSQPGSE